MQKKSRRGLSPLGVFSALSASNMLFSLTVGNLGNPPSKPALNYNRLSPIIDRFDRITIELHRCQ